MKPVFEEERQLLEKLLKKDLPTDLWRKAHALYLDKDLKEPLYRFRVKDNIVTITKDNSKKFKDYKQKGVYNTVKENREHLLELETKSIDFLYNYIITNPDVHQYVIGYSSGKDSVLTVYMLMKTFEKYPELVDLMIENDIKIEIQMANTSNDTAETYRNVQYTLPDLIAEFGFGVDLNIYHGLELHKTIEKHKGKYTIPISIYNPKVGFYNWLKHEKDYFLPSVMVRNCCSTYKEGETKKIYSKDEKIVLITGVRKHESFKRAKYDYIMDREAREKLFSTDSYPEKWVQIAPIVEWYNEDVWMYLLFRDIPFNPMYRKGYHRVGCLICPFQQNYIDKITEAYYPKQWDRWLRIVEKNYYKKNIGERLKWSLEEWQAGRWKQGTSKIYDITRLKATPKRIKQVTDILGVKEEIAAKYFEKKCSKCDKLLNPAETGMFLKMYGRYEGMEDNREYLCKKHMCEDLDITNKEYTQKLKEFSNSECELF